MKDKGIKPEWEVFSPTHLLQDVTACLKAGLDEKPYFINFVLGADRGFQGAMPYTPKVLQQMVCRPGELKNVDDWINRAAPDMTRPEAIRRRVEQALAAGARGSGHDRTRQGRQDRSRSGSKGPC